MLGIKKKRSAENKEWKNIKEVVDSYFESTKSERDKMTRYYDQFKGEIWNDEAMKSKGIENKSKAFINLIFSTVQSIAPMLTDSRPITSVIPRQPYMEKMAWKYNKGLEYAWDSLDMQMNITKMVIFALVMKKGIMKIYYDPEKTFGGDLCVENVDPRDFAIAPGYDDIWKAPWCGVRSSKPLTWIKANFPDVGDIKPDTSSLDDDKKKAFKYGESSDITKSAMFVRVYEIWMKDDKTFEEIKTECTDEDGNKTEKKEKKQKYPNGKFVYFTNDQYLGTTAYDFNKKLPPYVGLDIYIDPTGFLGMGEVDQTEGLNKELNLQAQAIFDHARRCNNPNYEVDISTNVDAEEIKESFFEGGQVYGVDKAYGSKEPVISEIPFAQMARDPYNVFNMIIEIFKKISGVQDINEGAASKSERQSASEIAILAESSNTRTRQKVRNLEWTLKRMGYLIVTLMQQYYTEPRTTYTTDSEGNVTYQSLGNSLAQARETIGPSPELEKKANSVENVRRDMEPQDADDYEQQSADLEKLLEAFTSEDGSLKEDDPVLFDFDIVIQTNSTLPLDHQSLANLALKLVQTKVIDPEAALDTLQFPGREKIKARMEQRQKASAQAKTGKPPQGGQ